MRRSGSWSSPFWIKPFGGSCNCPSTTYPFRFRLPANASAQAGDPSDPFKLVIVRDMWLTGFDAPSLHTMYLDKPMRAHGQTCLRRAGRRGRQVQAIARVNRVFRLPAGRQATSLAAW